MPVFNSTSWFITIYNFYSTRTNIKHILTKSINCNLLLQFENKKLNILWGSFIICEDR